eukprot:gene8113-30679_t
MAVQIARVFLAGLPRVDASSTDDEADVDAEGKPRKHVMLRGRTCAELATAEEALRSVVPTVALCNGRLPTFLRSMYAVTGGQEADGQEYCKQGLLHEHDGVSKYGVLCPLPSEVGFTYGGYFCYQTVSLLAWLGSDYEPTLSGEYPDLHGDGLVFAAACQEEESWAMYWKGQVRVLRHTGGVARETLALRSKRRSTHHNTATYICVLHIDNTKNSNIITRHLFQKYY